MERTATRHRDTWAPRFDALDTRQCRGAHDKANFHSDVARTAGKVVACD